MFDNYLKKISACVSFVFMLLGFVPSVSPSNICSDLDIAPREERTEVLSYKEVLRSYYDLAVKDSPNPTVTLESFVDGYYAQEQASDLQTYTLNVAVDNGNYEEVLSSLTTGKRSSLVTGGGGGINGQCEDCILRSINDREITPWTDFARPFFNNYYDYSMLRVGDVLFEEEGSIGSILGHNALIVSTNHKSDYGNYIQTVEAIQPCVSFGFVDDNRMVQFRGAIYRRRNLTTTQANTAVSFVKRQLGKAYAIRQIGDTTLDDSATTWYCSELVYAAFYHAGCQLYGCLVDGYFPPRVLIASDDLDPVYKDSKPYLTLSIVGKSGTKWRISAYNPNSYPVTIEYNSKMCWLDDAQYWRSALQNVKSTPCEAKQSVQFYIAENWFADSIGVSFLKKTTYVSKEMKYRFVTYGKDLDASNKKLSTWRHGVYTEEDKNI